PPRHAPIRGPTARAHDSRVAPPRRARSFSYLEPRLARAPLAVAVLLLQVAEDGPRIDAEVARRLGAVARVELQHLVDVLALELLLRLRERQDLRQHVAGEPEIVGPEHRLV